MEILIDDIPEEGMEIEATEGDPWFAGLVKEAIGDAFRDDDKARTAIWIVRFEDNITIDGHVDFTSHHTCDRCLEEFSGSGDMRVHTVLVPLHTRRGARHEGDELDLGQDDLEFGYYEGDRFDLTDVIRERVLLAEPMKHLCRADCKGLCQRCGKNLNDGLCGCVEDLSDSRFAALKKVKISPGRGH